MWAHFCQALTFLTRFSFSHAFSDPSRCVPYFVPAGLLLGFVLTVACFLVNQLFTVIAHCAFLAGFVWLVLEVWLTRALHWDGLADLADALGSGAQGERFLEILRDSRLGSFGAITLILVLLGHFLCLSLHSAAHQYGILILAPAYARAVPVLLARNAVPNHGSLLGLSVLQALDRYPTLYAGTFLFVVTLPLLLLAFVSLWQFILLLGLTWCLVRYLHKRAHENGGISGDYFGAGIVLAQLLFLFCTL